MKRDVKLIHQNGYHFTFYIFWVLCVPPKLAVFQASMLHPDESVYREEQALFPVVFDGSTWMVQPAQDGKLTRHQATNGNSQ